MAGVDVVLGQLEQEINRLRGVADRLQLRGQP